MVSSVAERSRGKRAGTELFVRLMLACALACAALGSSRVARADDSSEDDVVTREAHFDYDADTGLLYLDLLFRDIVDANLQSKLSRGLPTTIVLTAAVYRAGSSTPLSTTAQTCKVTWHVWEEAYLVEVMRPGSTRQSWTTTVEGVLRRCAEVRHLLAGDATQIPSATPLFAAGKIQVNPVSPELLQKIKRWVMRPSATGTAAPGDALFSTFTGLFLQRIGDAERQQKFTTKALLPSVYHSKAQ
ncbi:MAG TPA: hypothetical protein VHV51_10875 [Polyangiaceae bacterium]|nr:hypothetical protein [Polyangiaceae bacterium]